MNSVNAGCTRCSNQSGGFTPVSHRSKAMSFASSHPGSTKCTRLPSSSKQKIKKRCGYQWRQKCQNFAEKARSTLFGSFRALPPARHKSKIIAATSAWVETSRTGWARFSANSATRMLENPKYPSAIHSSAPHLEEASAKILAISVTSPTRSGGGVHVMAWTPPPERVGLVTLIAKIFAEASSKCGAFEWIALGYLGFSSMLVALFAENLAHPVRLVSTQALVAAMILLLCRAGGRARKLPNSVDLAFSAKFWHFWRHWYPHLFLIFCFEELGSLVHLVDPGWEDAKLMA